MSEFQSHRDNQRVTVEMWIVDALDGDHAAATLMSQLLWWFQNAKGTDRPRANYERDGARWLIRSDDAWHADCRLSPKQVRRIRKLLQASGFIVHRRFKVNGAPTGAWRPDFETVGAFIETYEAKRPNGQFTEPSTTQKGSSPTSETPKRANGTDPVGQVPISTDLSYRSKTKPKDVADSQANPDDPAVAELCNLLADAVANHGATRTVPKVTHAWTRDMSLLLRLGPRDTVPGPIDPQRVANAIRIVFQELAEPCGPDGFCWADQIQSPAALRRHWTKLGNAVRAKHNSGTPAAKALRLLDDMERQAR